MVRAERREHTQPVLTSDRDALNRTTRPATSCCSGSLHPAERGAMRFSSRHHRGSLFLASEDRLNKRRCSHAHQRGDALNRVKIPRVLSSRQDGLAA